MKYTQKVDHRLTSNLLNNISLKNTHYYTVTKKNMVYFVLLVWRLQKQNVCPLNPYFKSIRSQKLYFEIVKRTAKNPEDLININKSRLNKKLCTPKEKNKQSRYCRHDFNQSCNIRSQNSQKLLTILMRTLFVFKIFSAVVNSKTLSHLHW